MCVTVRLTVSNQAPYPIDCQTICRYVALKINYPAANSPAQNLSAKIGCSQIIRLAEALTPVIISRLKMQFLEKSARSNSPTYNKLSFL
jgi:hypothetical protein